MAPAAARARYAQDSAACGRIADADARASCRSEAAVRLGASLPQPAAGETPEQLQQNQRLRCEALPDPERTECLSRMRGEGRQSGSVEGGGVVRELVTREVGPPQKAASAP